MLIDTNNQDLLIFIEKRKKQLIDEKLNKGSYTSEDIALVRVTDHFPIDKKIYSISNVPFVVKLNDIPKEFATYKLFNLEEKIKNQDYQTTLNTIKEINEKAKEYSPYSTQYRSSIHFCLNGVVSSHIMGNFENKPYVIIEPFSFHEKDSNILSVRAEDTYFKDAIILSDKAIILVDEYYKDNILNINNSSNFNIIFYRGNQKTAIEVVLLWMNIIPELMANNHVVESPTSKLLINFIQEKKYNTEKHCLSQSYYNDDQRNLILWKKYAENFYTFLYSKIVDEATIYEKEIKFLSESSYRDKEALILFEKIINKIGINNYKLIVDEYNQFIIEQIKEGKYPTNNDILDGAPLGISVNKSNYK